MVDRFDWVSDRTRWPVIGSRMDRLSPRPRWIDRVGSTSTRLRVYSGGPDAPSDSLGSIGDSFERGLDRVRWSVRPSDPVL